MTVHFSWNKSTFPPFIECLESLPNLHTLEIGWRMLCYDLTQGRSQGCKTPSDQDSHPTSFCLSFLQHCHNVEDVVHVVRGESETAVSDEFLRTLASKQGSNVRRLAIPLILWADLSCRRFITLHNHGVNTITDRPRRQYS